MPKGFLGLRHGANGRRMVGYQPQGFTVSRDGAVILAQLIAGTAQQDPGIYSLWRQRNRPCKAARGLAPCAGLLVEPTECKPGGGEVRAQFRCCGKLRCGAGPPLQRQIGLAEVCQEPAVGAKQPLGALENHHRILETTRQTGQYGAIQMQQLAIIVVPRNERRQHRLGIADLAAFEKPQSLAPYGGTICDRAVQAGEVVHRSATIYALPEPARASKGHAPGGRASKRVQL